MDYRRTCLSYHILFHPTYHFTCPDHWHDVLVGATLGTVLAYFSYRQYYPSLVSKDSQFPYSPRHTFEETVERLPIHNLHTFGESVDHGSHARYSDDHHDGLAETVPRPETGLLKNVWRGEDV
jgi:diacylglycerol diphosphate phosphatase/phosphatidate phosphatase